MAGSVDSRKVAQWRQRLERFKRRGSQTVAAFCLAEDVSLPSLYQWRKRLALRRATPGRQTDFAEVRVLKCANLSVRLPGGTRLEIPLADHGALQLAIAALVRADGERSDGSQPGGPSC